MLMSSFLTSLRAKIGDTGTTKIWADGDLLAFANEAIPAVGRDHPEVTLDDDGALIALPATLTDASAFPLADAYQRPCLEYAAYLAFSVDSRDKQDENRAAQHWAAYQSYFANRMGA